MLVMSIWFMDVIVSEQIIAVANVVLKTAFVLLLIRVTLLFDVYVVLALNPTTQLLINALVLLLVSLLALTQLQPVRPLMASHLYLLLTILNSYTLNFGVVRHPQVFTNGLIRWQL